MRTRRQELIDLIQGLSAAEGRRQPSAVAWLADQDARKTRRTPAQPDNQARETAPGADGQTGSEGT